MANPSATLEQLVAETGWLHRLALALVKDEAVAKDLVQDTYIVAATEAPTDGRPLRPWLARVLWNRIRMRSRSGARRRAREETFGAHAASPPSRPDEIVDRIKLQRLLVGFVLDLAPPQRDVLLLHYFEGMTSSQIGARLGIAPGTVRWRLKQALDELRGRLEERSPNHAWIAPVAALGRSASTAPVAKAFALPKLLVVAFVALAIVALVLRSQVRDATTGVANRPVTHVTTTAERPIIDIEDPDSPAARAASTRGPDQGFGNELRRLDGKVIDDAGQPVDGADVEVDCEYRDDLPRPHLRTGPGGTFAFDVDPHCRFSVFATKGEARGMETWFGRSAKWAMTIRLHRLTRAVIRVLDAETGAPIANADVTSRRMFFDSVSAVTGPDGIVRMSVRVPSHITVDAAHYVYTHELLEDPDHPATRKDRLFYDEDQPEGRVPSEVHLDIRMQRGIVVSGSVVGPDGATVPSAHVSLEGPVGAEHRVYATATTDASGRFETNLPGAGRYGLSADRRDLTSRELVAVDVTSQGRRDLVAHVVRRGGVHGTVVDPGHRPVAGAKVSLADGTLRPVSTDASGRFTIENVDGVIDLIAHRGTEASAFQHIQVTAGESAEAVLQIGPTGISGIAIDRDGAPVAGAYVWLNYCCESSPMLVDGVGVTTDASGRFSFDVPRGDFVLSVKRNFEDDYEDEDDLKVTGGSHDVRLLVP